MIFSSPLRRIAPNKTSIHLHHHHISTTTPSIIKTKSSSIITIMSDEVTNKNQSGTDTSTDENKKAPEKAVEPPEKPLPDDCCGSGCVRCVWDIYYDELEDYNKLVSVIENNNKTDKPS